MWQGEPAGGLRFRASDIFTSLFGLAFFSFAIFWITMASSMTSRRSFNSFSSGPDLVFQFFPLFGIPFVLVGAYLLFGGTSGMPMCAAGRDTP